jgi:hypothetical protein
MQDILIPNLVIENLVVEIPEYIMIPKIRIELLPFNLPGQRDLLNSHFQPMLHCFLLRDSSIQTHQRLIKSSIKVWLHRIDRQEYSIIYCQASENCRSFEGLVLDVDETKIIRVRLNGDASECFRKHLSIAIGRRITNQRLEIEQCQSKSVFQRILINEGLAFTYEIIQRYADSFLVYDRLDELLWRESWQLETIKSTIDSPLSLKTVESRFRTIRETIFMEIIDEFELRNYIFWRKVYLLTKLDRWYDIADMVTLFVWRVIHKTEYKNSIISWGYQLLFGLFNRFVEIKGKAKILQSMVDICLLAVDRIGIGVDEDLKQEMPFSSSETNVSLLSGWIDRVKGDLNRIGHFRTLNVILDKFGSFLMRLGDYPKSIIIFQDLLKYYRDNDGSIWKMISTSSLFIVIMNLEELTK